MDKICGFKLKDEFYSLIYQTSALFKKVTFSVDLTPMHIRFYQIGTSKTLFNFPFHSQLASFFFLLFLFFIYFY